MLKYFAAWPRTLRRARSLHAARRWYHSWLAGTLLLYLLLTGYQLGLPGLHYDEAREAGVNAMELLTGAPVTPFRGVALGLGEYRLPLMVQDYIGALNVYLALPLLWLTGIGVPNLRLLPVLTGLATLLTVERTVTAWLYLTAQPKGAQTGRPLPLSTAGLLAMTLLVAAPSFVFWSRQGIFVTNLTQPLCFWCLWQGLRWLENGRRRHLLWSAFAGGCALYAKLLAIWVIAPFVLLALGWWLWRLGKSRPRPPLSLALCLGSVGAFTFPLLPLLWFNLQSSGTFTALTGNLRASYYGVDNLALLANLAIRWQQFGQMLRGDHLWYLGGLYGNGMALWGALALVALGLLVKPWPLLLPVFLLLAAFGASLFTISALFVTHYALLQPLAAAVIALAWQTLFTGHPEHNHFRLRSTLWRWVGIGLVLLWLLADLSATVRYHSALTHSGGLADHADTSYHLAYYLRYNGLGAPIALDWGFDAPMRYLTVGTVTPVEIFGYRSPHTPDADFGSRLGLFLDNPANVYLLHTDAATVFAGRRAQFLQAAADRGLQPALITTFAQRDGTPVVEVWRVIPAPESR